MISRDYTNLSVVKWVRKKIFRVHKPPYIPFGRWERWYRLAKKEHPIAWFFTETVPCVLEKIVGFLTDPLIDFKNRWVMKKIICPHLINTGLSSLHHHDYKKKFLHALYSELVNYVEVVLANRWVGFGIVQQRKYNFPVWKKHWWLNWRPWRCAAAGLDSLKWQTDVYSADPIGTKRGKVLFETAQETILLYSWWVHIRPRRGSSWQAAGLDEFMKKLNDKYGVDAMRAQWTTKEDAEYKLLIDLQEQLEISWELEDHNMLIRLINLSPHLIY